MNSLYILNNFSVEDRIHFFLIKRHQTYRDKKLDNKTEMEDDILIESKTPKSNFIIRTNLDISVKKHLLNGLFLFSRRCLTIITTAAHCQRLVSPSISTLLQICRVVALSSRSLDKINEHLMAGIHVDYIRVVDDA